MSAKKQPTIRKALIPTWWERWHVRELGAIAALITALLLAIQFISHAVGRPHLVGEIKRVSVYHTTNSELRQVGTEVIMLVNVENTGSVPTVADNWSLDIESQINNFKALTPTVIPEELILPLPASFNGQREVIHGAEGIYEKVMRTPLRQGDPPEIGWIMFLLPNLPSEANSAFGTKYTVHFKDNRHHEYIATYVLSPERTNLMYFPGVEQTFHPEAK